MRNASPAERAVSVPVLPSHRSHPLLLRRADTFIRGRDPEVCLPGVLARYMRLRHLLLPMPLGPDDTLERFAAWALQPLFQTQISAQAHAQAHARTGSSGPPGTVPFMGTDKDVSRAATHLKNLYSAAGIEKTPGFCARRLRQGGTNAAMQRDLPPKVVAKRMGHNSGDVHVENYTGMFTESPFVLARTAGHAGDHIRLGRTAVSARRGPLRPLYDAVSGLPEGAGERLRGWLAFGHPLAPSLRQMWMVLEHLPDVLLQDLAVLQRSGNDQVQAYYSGLNARSNQLNLLHWGRDLSKDKQTSVVDSYPFLDPSSELHHLWLQYQDYVLERQQQLHVRNPPHSTIQDLARKMDELYSAQAAETVENGIVTDEEDWQSGCEEEAERVSVSGSKRSRASKGSSVASNSVVQLVGEVRDSLGVLMQQSSRVPRLQDAEDVTVSARLHERLHVEKTVQALAEKKQLMPELRSWENWSGQLMCDRFSATASERAAARACPALSAASRRPGTTRPGSSCCGARASRPTTGEARERCASGRTSR